MRELDHALYNAKQLQVIHAHFIHFICTLQNFYSILVTVWTEVNQKAEVLFSVENESGLRHSAKTEYATKSTAQLSAKNETKTE